MKGVIVQFGGQTPLKLAQNLEKANIPILGTSTNAIDLAEDRKRFQELLNKLCLRQPPNGTAKNTREALTIAEKIGYPVVIRPSYVLGGRAMEIVHDKDELERYVKNAEEVTAESPILIDWYLRDAITGVPVAKIAAKIMTGLKLKDFKLSDNEPTKHVAVKEAVFPFSRFPGVDIILGPEMKSTGEVMGIDRDFASAFAKSQLGAGTVLPKNGTVFLSVRDPDKENSLSLANRLIGLGFKIMATRGTGSYLEANNVKVETINKVQEGRPHCVDAIKSGAIQLIINTSEGNQAVSDSFSIRRSALMSNIPHYTTLAGAAAAISAIESISQNINGRGLEVETLQNYFNN